MPPKKTTENKQKIANAEPENMEMEVGSSKKITEKQHRSTRATAGNKSKISTLEVPLNTVERTSSTGDLPQLSASNLCDGIQDHGVNGARSKSTTGKKKTTRSRQSKIDVFQSPLMHSHSSMTPASVSNDIPLMYSTPTGSQSFSRKSSLDNTAIQIQLNNRQTEEFRKIVQENNDRIVQRVYEISTMGDENLLERINNSNDERELRLENKISAKLQKGENETLIKIDEMLEKRDNKMDRRLNSFEAQLRNDMTNSMRANENRLKKSINELEKKTQESVPEITTRLSIKSHTEEIYHEELVIGLKQIEETKTRFNTVGEKIEQHQNEQKARFEVFRRENIAQLEGMKETMMDITTRMSLFENAQQLNNDRLEKIDQLERDNRQLQERMSRIEATQNERYEELQARMEQMNNRITSDRQRDQPSEDSSLFVSQLEIDHKSLNLLITGLPHDLHSTQGVLRFAYNKLNLNIAEEEIIQVFKIAETNRGPIIKVRFHNILTRTAFYKARTRLGPSTSIWINEDLIKINEGIAYEARQIVGKSIYKTWTYLGQVFIQYNQDGPSRKITRLEDLPNGENIARRRRLQQSRIVIPQTNPTRINPRQNLPQTPQPSTRINSRQNLPQTPQPSTSGMINRDQLNLVEPNGMPKINEIPSSMRINNRQNNPGEQAITKEDITLVGQHKNLIDWENEVPPETVTLQPLQSKVGSSSANINKDGTSTEDGKEGSRILDKQEKMERLDRDTVLSDSNDAATSTTDFVNRINELPRKVTTITGDNINRKTVENGTSITQ